MKSIFLNSSLPLIFSEWILLGFSLLFIVLIETYVYHKFRKDLKRSFYEISIVNIFSTLIGIPIANIIRFFSMKVLALVLPLQWFPNKDIYDWESVSPGRPDSFQSFEQYFIVGMILLINFVVTYYSEYYCLTKLNKEFDKRLIKKVTFRFNVIT